MLTNRIKLLSLVFSILILSGCKINYSFTGASIPPEVKTINIIYFPNNAPLVVPTLSQTLTDGLRDRFTSETSLDLVNEGGDLIMEGSITGYRTSPIAMQTNQGEDQAALNRLTISIEVTYTNTFDDNLSFESNFSRYADYSSQQNLEEVQDGLIEEINSMLIDDVFNKAVVNW